jgi:hypothetical protein
MTICAPKLQGHACTRILYKGYEISIAMDDSCGAFNDYSRSSIAVFDENGADVTVGFFTEPRQLYIDGTAENLIAIFAKIDELSAPEQSPERWVLSYPRKGRSQYVGPFPTEQAAFDFPIESDVCSVSRLYTPEQDMEYDD